MYTSELTNCPGCRNACPIENPTCMIGEKFLAQEKAKREKQEGTAKAPPAAAEE